MYAMYIGVNSYYNDGEVSDSERNGILLLLAYSGSVGFLTRAIACAEINYGFEPLNGNWNYNIH